MKTSVIILLSVVIWAVIPANGQNGSENYDHHFSEGWQIIPSGVEEHLLSVHFVNSTTGFIGGALTRCLKTTNGGLNWTPVTVPSYADFNAVWTTSSDKALLGGWDSVYTTQNGGLSWQGAYTQTVNYAIHDLQFISPDNGFAFMTWAQMAKTTDGGNNWSLAAGAGFTAWDFFGGYMLDQNTGYAVGDNQLLCKTTDGGDNFQVYEWNGYLDFTGIRIWSVFANSELSAVAVADSGVIFRTTDGGNYWGRYTIAGPEDNLLDICFINANTGYIVGSNGKIFKTTDGGENWIQEPSVTDNQLNAVFFISETLGWAVGDFGTILRFEGTNSVGQLSRQEFAAQLIISPNPVENNSYVSFTLKESKKVRVEVRDATGRVVSVVSDGLLSKGEHSVLLNLQSLSNGIYLCHLSSQGDSICKPFVLSK